MKEVTKETLTESISELEEKKNVYGVLAMSSEYNLKVYKMLLATMGAEPVRNPVLAYADSYRDMAKQGVESVPIWSVITDLERNIAPLYIHAQQQVVPETAHSSVIAEQLAHVLSDMKVTDHQRAVISCAVDRLNNVAQLLQLSPSALLVPEILDYQGAKELYNYLMTEEEINATVNAWNACRAAMLNQK